METNNQDNKIVVDSLIAVTSLFFLMWLYTSFFVLDKESLMITLSGNLFFTLSTLLASVIAFEQSKEWGGRGSTLGKSFFYFGLGILSYGIGFFIRMVYPFLLSKPAPFPSVSDIFRIAYYPFLIYALIVLIIELKAGLSSKDSIILFIMPLVLLVFFYITFFKSNFMIEGNPLKSAIAVFYPVADIVLVSLCVMLLVLCYKGNFEKGFVLITVGIVFQAIGDFGFALTNITNNYFIGSWIDLVLTLGMAVIAVGIFILKPSAEMQPKKNIKIGS